MPAALFFDVDGTLVDSFHDSRQISPAVLAELRRVQAAGHKIFVASGRPRLLLTPELLRPGFDGLVLVNGGYVELGGQSVYEERMGEGLARRVVDFLEELGGEYLVTSARSMYTRPSNHGIREFFGGKEHEGIFTFDFDLADVLPQAIKMETLTPTEERARVTALVHEVLGPKVNCDGHGGEGTFELYPSAISKARGIEVALGLLGLSAADAFAFGDGTNDIEMLQYCGCGVAMGNATCEVKAEADIVCPPVWDDGLAQVLRELF